MNKVTLQIDNKQISVPAGSSVIQAARSLGIDIPHLCYHPALPPNAACRLCVVEVEGAQTLAASCALPVVDGMVVRTNTERVQAARRLVLDLILSDHPLDCLTCEAAGVCKLQRYAYQLGVTSSTFAGERHEDAVDHSNPFFLRNYQKCVLCGLCVSACNNVHRMGAISFSNKGFDTRVATAFDWSLSETSCNFCGNCIQVCPTGALVEHDRVGKGREWEMTRVKSICVYCGCGCGLELVSKDGQIVRVRGDEENPVNRGWLCVKGRFGFHFINHDDRLVTPLRRERTNGSNGGMGTPHLATHTTAVSWDDALDLTAKRLMEIRDAHGPDAIAFLSSAKCSNEENYLMQKLARGAMGTNNVDHCARLCHASTVAGLAQAFGSGAMTNSIHEFADTDAFLVIGSNTSETHPLVAVQIKAAVRDKGAQLIVCDPRQIELTGYAAHWLRHRPGTDVALVNAMLKVMIDEGLVDRKFIEERTEGFDVLVDTVADCTLEWGEGITGVPAPAIRDAAIAFATADRAAIMYAMGITQHTTGTDNVLALANLALATGNLGTESVGVNPLRGQNNVQGACDMGALPGDYPGYQKVANEETRAKFEAGWGTLLPGKPGLTLVEMMHAAREGKLKAMVIMGENPLVTDPNTNEVRKALANLEFVCVSEMFETDTTEYADVILPAASFAEKAGTFTNTERRVQLFGAGIPALPGAKADWEILRDLANRLGADWSYPSPAEVFAEMASLTPQFGGMSHARLKTESLQWPCPTPDHPGTPVLHREKFTRGLGKFHAVDFKPPAELPDEDYPMVFTTGRQLFQYHSGTMTRRSPGIEQHRGKATVEINPVDAGRLGIVEDQPVRVVSRRGEVVVAAEITDRIGPGMLFMAFHYREAIANLVTNDAFDPVAKIPELKVCAVRVEVNRR